MRRIFSQFDSNGDGVIDAEEWRGLLKMLPLLAEQQAFSDRDCEQFMTEMDENGDGSIDFNEFLTWITREDRAPLRVQIMKRLKMLQVALKEDEGDGEQSNLIGTPSQSRLSMMPQTSHTASKQEGETMASDLPNLLTRSSRRSDSKRLVGPERFFYDKGSYTGTHARGGPHHVSKGMGSSGHQFCRRGNA
jgi:hypothetical protein